MLTAALEALAEEDPTAALIHLESLAPNQDKEPLLRAVATGYARYDIDAAVVWVQSLNPPSASAVYAVTSELASVDLLRAVDFDLALGSSLAPPAWMILRTGGDLNEPARVADRIVAARESARRTSLLRPVIERWGETDPYGALTWLQAHQDEEPTLIRTLASRLGERDLAQALDFVTLVPRQFRVEWARQAVRANAANDTTATLETLEMFRSEPYYGEAVADVVLSAASRHGPVVAAELLDRAPEAAIKAAAVSVAMQWAYLDAPAAADWAAEIPAPEIRFDAVRAVLETWIPSDGAAASRWTYGLADAKLRARVSHYICDRMSEALHCGA